MLMNVQTIFRWEKEDGSPKDNVYTETITVMNEICAGQQPGEAHLGHYIGKISSQSKQLSF